MAFSGVNPKLNVPFEQSQDVPLWGWEDGGWEAHGRRLVLQRRPGWPVDNPATAPPTQIKLCWGIDRVYYAGEDGALRHVPVGWTSVAAADPFVSVARGRSAFRVEDLLALAEEIDRAL